jgi:pilus assembly protein CpaF
VHAQAVSALDAVIHVSRRADGSRRVAEIGFLERVPTGLRVVPLTDVGRQEASRRASSA